MSEELKHQIAKDLKTIRNRHHNINHIQRLMHGTNSMNVNFSRLMNVGKNGKLKAMEKFVNFLFPFDDFCEVFIT